MALPELFDAGMRAAAFNPIHRAGARVLLPGLRRPLGRYRIRRHLPLRGGLGAGILWFGWFGFNAGSAPAADNLYFHACVNPNTATAVAVLG